VIAARGLAVGRGATLALREIDLDVAPGERLALVGANGAGKTSLLRVLAGIDAPRAGTITWDGGALPSGAARAQAVGVVFQGESPSRFDVRGLVTLGLGLDGPPLARDRAAVELALENADLAHLATRPCTMVSGGEMQRALLARALVAGQSVAAKRVLLLDEPTHHLDPARHAALLAYLDELRGDVAVVVATHDLALAATCDRVALLAHGTLAAIGSPNEVLTPERLASALAVDVRRVDDPMGGPPLFRILGRAHAASVAGARA
jgi:iron complex transport system ATP-binding protein